MSAYIWKYDPHTPYAISHLGIWILHLDFFLLLLLTSSSSASAAFKWREKEIFYPPLDTAKAAFNPLPSSFFPP